MKRVLALVVAVALVAGAYAVRTRVIDDDATRCSPAAAHDAEAPVVACAPELLGCATRSGEPTESAWRRARRPRRRGRPAGRFDAWLTYGPCTATWRTSPSARRSPTAAGVVVGHARSAIADTRRRASGAAAARASSRRCHWSCLARAAARTGRRSSPRDSRHGEGRDRRTRGRPWPRCPPAPGRREHAEPRPRPCRRRRQPASADRGDVRRRPGRGRSGHSAGHRGSSGVLRWSLPPTCWPKTAAGSARAAGADDSTVLYPGPVATTTVVLAPVGRSRVSSGWRTWCARVSRPKRAGRRLGTVDASRPAMGDRSRLPLRRAPEGDPVSPAPRRRRRLGGSPCR